MELNQETNREMSEDERKFAQAAKQALRQSERTLDAPTAARLRAAREHALAAAARPQRVWNWAWGWMGPAGAVTAALMVFALLPTRAPLNETPAMPRGEAYEVMLDDVEPGLVEDLELYVWLEFDGEPA